jgi:hypothetical protein
MWNDPPSQGNVPRKQRGQPSDDGDNDDDIDDGTPRGPVLKEMKDWEEIKGGLVGLVKALPKLIGWIDNSLHSRLRHSIKAKRARKIRNSSPQSAEKPAPPNSARRKPQPGLARPPPTGWPTPLAPRTTTTHRQRYARKQ